MTEAVGGDHLPSWETVAAFVSACNGKPNEWRPRWERAREERMSASTQRDETVDVEEQTVAGLPRSFRRRLLPYVATVIVTAVAASTATATAFSLRHNLDSKLVASRSSTRAAVIIVQNKVALGADSL